MAGNPKELGDLRLVAWRKPGVDTPFEVLAFVPEPTRGFEKLLAFLTAARDDLTRYGKATRHLKALSRPEDVALLGEREGSARLVEHIELRADQARTGSVLEVSGQRATFRLSPAGFDELVEATRLQAERSDTAFHGSFTSWGFGYAIDWHGAE